MIKNGKLFSLLAFCFALPAFLVFSGCEINGEGETETEAEAGKEDFSIKVESLYDLKPGIWSGGLSFLTTFAEIEDKVAGELVYGINNIADKLVLVTIGFGLNIGVKGGDMVEIIDSMCFQFLDISDSDASLLKANSNNNGITGYDSAKRSITMESVNTVPRDNTGSPEIAIEYMWLNQTKTAVLLKDPEGGLITEAIIRWKAN